jgi:hypothetical protein
MEDDLTFPQIIDGLSAPIATITPDGRIDFVNRQLLDFLGMSLEKLEQHIRRADGSHHWVHVRGLPLRDTEGRVLRWCVLLADIDNRKATEAFLAGEKRLLEMVASGCPLRDVFEAMYGLVETVVSNSTAWR